MTRDDIKTVKVRKRPVEVEALQYTGDNLAECLMWALNMDHLYALACADSGQPLWISTLEGSLRASPGDWIICGVKGEFYPCKPDIFEATYEEVRYE